MGLEINNETDLLEEIKGICLKGENTIWFSGASGKGKTRVVKEVEKELGNAWYHQCDETDGRDRSLIDTALEKLTSCDIVILDDYDKVVKEDYTMLFELARIQNFIKGTPKTLIVVSQKVLLYGAAFRKMRCSVHRNRILIFSD